MAKFALLGSALILSLATASARPSLASETTTYTYDALGRLSTTSNSGGPRSGNSTASRYDPAGNRAAVAVNQALPTESTAVTFSLSGPSTVAKGAAAVFSIAKTGSASTNVTLNYATANGSASTPTHYTGGAATLVFRPWETLKTISIPTIDDGQASPARTFSMTISSPSTGGTISTAAATVTIAASAGNAPIANNDSATVGVCSGKYVNVTANDTDPNGGYPLTVISAVTANGNGTVTVENASTVRYLAYGGTGADWVTYTIRNAAGYTATGTLTMTIVDNGGCQ